MDAASMKSGLALAAGAAAAVAAVVLTVRWLIRGEERKEREAEPARQHRAPGESAADVQQTPKPEQERRNDTQADKAERIESSSPASDGARERKRKKRRSKGKRASVREEPEVTPSAGFVVAPARPGELDDAADSESFVTVSRKRRPLDKHGSMELIPPSIVASESQRLERVARIEAARAAEEEALSRRTRPAESKVQTVAATPKAASDVSSSAPEDWSSDIDMASADDLHKGTTTVHEASRPRNLVVRTAPWAEATKQREKGRATLRDIMAEQRPDAPTRAPHPADTVASGTTMKAVVSEATADPSQAPKTIVEKEGTDEEDDWGSDASGQLEVSQKLSAPEDLQDSADSELAWDSGEEEGGASPSVKEQNLAALADELGDDFVMEEEEDEKEESEEVSAAASPSSLTEAADVTAEGTQPRRGPALIAHLGGSTSVKEVGSMVYDPVAMKWVAKDPEEEEDPFADFSSDEESELSQPSSSSHAASGPDPASVPHVSVTGLQAEAVSGTFSPGSPLVVDPEFRMTAAQQRACKDAVEAWNKIADAWDQSQWAFAREQPAAPAADTLAGEGSAASV